MCGIYGTTEYNPDLVSEIINKCSHRGPDGQSIWSNNSLTLGHNLLSITSSPDDGRQPYVSSRGNVLIYNGELFNYNDLIKRFKDRFNPKSSCDTELLAWLLDNYSYEEVLSKLIDSMHAFVFFNKSKNEIILSRDHAGIKPLYFSEYKNGIVFSSEIKGLLNIAANARKIDKLGLVCICFLGVNVLRQTIFNGINKVLPGETIIFCLETKKIKSKFRNVIKPNSNRNFNIEEFYEQSKIAINNSTLGIRSFGMFLSGGLDSSVIALGLKNKLGQLNSFTNIMEPNVIDRKEDHNSDANIARKFAKEIKLSHNEITITPETFIENWNDSIKYIEEPRYNWNLPMYYYTNNILSKNKTVVTMAGDMGDEIFGGYAKYLRMYNLEKKPNSWEEFIRMWMIKFTAPVLLNMKFNYEDLHSILIKALPEEIWNPEDIANSAMALDCITTVSEDFFSRNDKFGMAFSMEGRFPFASKNFMQYCLNIKSAHKFDFEAEETKIIIKRTFCDRLPGYVLNKPKTGWSAPIMSWLNTNEALNNKFLKDITTEDGVEKVISKNNFVEDPNIGESLSGKRKIISWMFRSWAQEFDMSL